jgi:hypothetical protein
MKMMLMLANLSAKLIYVQRNKAFVGVILFQIHPLTQTIYVLTNNTKIKMVESLH